MASKLTDYISPVKGSKCEPYFPKLRMPRSAGIGYDRIMKKSEVH